MTTRLATLLLALSITTPALADSANRQSWPAFLSDQPLALPPYLAEASADVTVFNLKGGSASTTLGLGFDIGVLKRLQVGVSLAVPLSPTATMGNISVHIEIPIVRQLDVRIDVGYLQEAVFGLSADDGDDAGGIKSHNFFGGVGLPYRIRLHHMVTLDGGSSRARGFGVLPHLNVGEHISYYGVPLTDDLFTITAGGSLDGSGASVEGVVYIPVGLTVQPIAPLSFGFHTGYRLYFFHESGHTSTTDYVPLQFDVAAHILRLIDVGFRATLLGPVHGSSDPTGFDYSHYYADYQQYDIYVAGRF